MHLLSVKGKMNSYSYSYCNLRDKDPSLYLQCLGVILRLPVHETEQMASVDKEQIADECIAEIFSNPTWKYFIQKQLNDPNSLKNVLNLLYPLMLRSSFPHEGILAIVGNLGLLIKIIAGQEDMEIDLGTGLIKKKVCRDLNYKLV
jgi:hypothetical protein